MHRTSISPIAAAVSKKPGLAAIRSATSGHSTSGIDQHSGVEDAVRIEFFLRGPKGGREKFRALTIVPRPVIAANGVMMRDPPTPLDHRISRRPLHDLPLPPNPTLAPLTL